MRLAWFHPGPLAQSLTASDAVDLSVELGARHTIDRFNASSAHEFVWQHARSPYDLMIFELGDAPAYDFVWAYLFHYPGIVILHAASLQRSRTRALAAARRQHDLRVERAFSHGDFLRAPLLGARLVVVRDQADAEDVRERVAGVNVTVIPVGVTPVPIQQSFAGCRFLLVGNREDAVRQAAVRARETGTTAEVCTDASQLDDATVVIALEWPPAGAAPVEALRAMAAGLPVIVFETEATASWPTLDPQTWQPRGYVSHDAPVAVSIDPRDEEHSLMLAMRRLSSDASLRSQLSAAAIAWAGEHASVQRAARLWDVVLLEALRHDPVLRKTDLPPHLTADGTAVARAILDEFGATVDFLS